VELTLFGANFGDVDVPDGIFGKTIRLTRLSSLFQFHDANVAAGEAPKSIHFRKCHNLRFDADKRHRHLTN
jgi:hypothetical protein